MSASTTGRAAPFIIAAAVIVGGHMMLVSPAKRHLAQARAQNIERETEAQRLQSLRSALPALAAAREQASLDAEAIERGNAPAKDPGILFASLAALASEHNVRVDQLDPFVPRTSVAAPAQAVVAAADPAQAPLEPDIQLGYTMTVIASYGDLAAFLGAIQSELGFTRILSVRIAPAPEGAETVAARIQTVHHAFTLPPICFDPPSDPSGGPTQ